MFNFIIALMSKHNYMTLWVAHLVPATRVSEMPFPAL
jgi:hypothetical protein